MFQSDTHHLHLQCSRYLANQFFKAEIRGGKNKVQMVSREYEVRMTC